MIRVKIIIKCLNFFFNPLFEIQCASRTWRPQPYLPYLSYLAPYLPYLAPYLPYLASFPALPGALPALTGSRRLTCPTLS